MHDSNPFLPTYFHSISHTLSASASHAYSREFDIGLESWRILMLLETGLDCSARCIHAAIGMDKAAVSRCFRKMEKDGLIRLHPGRNSESRRIVASITRKGKELHGRIMAVALARERALLTGVTAEEHQMLLALLRRLCNNLPAVEAVTEDGRHPIHQVEPSASRPRL